MNKKRLGVIENKDVTVEDFKLYLENKSNDKRLNNRAGSGETLDKAKNGSKILLASKK